MVVGVLCLSVLLAPAAVWDHPDTDAAYVGFDRSLIYVDEKGGFPEKGVVEVTPRLLRLTALPNSQPTVHLVTSPLQKLIADMRVRILDVHNQDTPFRVGFWTPRNNDGVFVNFVGERVVLQTISHAQVAREEALGEYRPGRQYHVQLSLDKEAGTISSRITGLSEGSRATHRALRIVGQELPQWFAHVYSTPVPVRRGEEYVFGGTIKLLRGSGAFGFVLEWRDRAQKRVGKAEQWHGVPAVEEWTGREFRARAPAQASFAVLEIATTTGTDVLFTDLVVRPARGRSPNLLPNGDFHRGIWGWRRGSAEPIPPELVDSSAVDLQAMVRKRDLPELFQELRLSLSVSALAQTGLTSAIVDGYTLVVPHQWWLTARIADPRNRDVVVILLVAGAILYVLRGIGWLRSRTGRGAGDLPRRLWEDPRFPIIVAGSAAGLVYVALNALLFNRGSLNYDLLSGTVWGYTTARYGLTRIYDIPVVTGVPEAWSGIPMQEAAFPYLPVLAYGFSAVGWIYRILLAPPGPLVREAFSLAFVIKALNAVFSYGSALLIYLILRRQTGNTRASLLASSFFLLNPAVVFVGSVWGQTQTWSIFLLLLAVWMWETDRIYGAWLALGATALTRQQMLVPAVLLALVFLRRIPFRRNLDALAWVSIAGFLLLGPFLLALGSSLIVDLLANTARLHLVGLNDQWTSLVSWGALSVWPLVTQVVHGQTGLGRLSLSSRTPLVGSVTYWQLGNWLFGVLFVVLAVLLARRPTGRGRPRDDIPPVALGTLGLFLLKTEFAAFHLLPALALVVLTRRSTDDVTYATMLLVLTTTTFAAMYGMAAVWLSYSPQMSLGLFDPANPVTRFFRELVGRDWFITSGSLANLLVFVWLAVLTLRGRFPFGGRDRTGSATERSGVARPRL